jgi:hypothetical protein
MGSTWRFYVGADGRWAWEQLGRNGLVLHASRASYDSYDAATAAAAAFGYTYVPSQKGLPRGGNWARRSFQEAR